LQPGKCADNLPNFKNEKEYNLENIKFHALKLSNVNIKTLCSSTKEPNVDRRTIISSKYSEKEYEKDLIDNALETDSKQGLVKYAQIWNDIAAFIAFFSVLILQLINTSIIGIITTVIVIAIIYTTGLPIYINPFKNLKANNLVYALQAAATFIVLPAVTGFFGAFLMDSLLPG